MRMQCRCITLLLPLLLWQTQGRRIANLDIAKDLQSEGSASSSEGKTSSELNNASFISSTTFQQGHPSNTDMHANQCAGNWVHMGRYRCDQMLMTFIRDLSPYYDDFLIDMRVLEQRQRMSAIAQCYMRDICFQRPREPAFMHVSKDPFVNLHDMHYFSYKEWWAGMQKAWHQISSAQRKTILIVPFFGGAAAGVSGKSNPDFDQDLARLPEMFYKSELWTQMHLLNAFPNDISGIAFVGKGVDKRRLGNTQLENVCERDRSGYLLPDYQKCNFALAFDVTYSGLQLEGDAQNMFGTKGANLLGQNYYNTVVHRADPGRKLVLLGVTHNNYYQKYMNQAYWEYNVIFGHVSKTGYRGGSTKIPGGQKPMLVPQFKIPDGASLDQDTAKHLEFLLCCCGYDTRRPPYKVYRNFRPTPCQPSNIALAAGSAASCHYVKSHCPAMFPSYSDGGSGGSKAVASFNPSGSHPKVGTDVLRFIQHTWLDDKARKFSRSDLFDWIDTNYNGRISKSEWMSEMPKWLKSRQKWMLSADDGAGFTRGDLEANFEYLCQQSPGCDPNYPASSALTYSEFKQALETVVKTTR